MKASSKLFLCVVSLVAFSLATQLCRAKDMELTLNPPAVTPPEGAKKVKLVVIDNRYASQEGAQFLPPEKAAKKYAKVGLDRMVGDGHGVNWCVPKGERAIDKVAGFTKAALAARGYAVVDDGEAPIVIEMTIDHFWAHWGVGAYGANIVCRFTVRADGKDTNFKIESVGRFPVIPFDFAFTARMTKAFEFTFSTYKERLEKKLAEVGI